MSYEKKFNKIKIALQRLGIPLQETDEDVTFEESAIVSTILANPNNTKTITDEAIKAHEALLIGKIRKSVEGLGVEVGEEQDIKKLMDLSKTHLLKTAGEGKEEFIKKNSELQTQIQEYKVAMEGKQNEFTSKFEKLNQEKESEINRIRRNTQVTTYIGSKNLTDAAKKNINRITEDLLSPKLDKLEIKEENGKKFIYSEGNKRFKSDITGGESNSEQATLEDVIDFELDQLGFIKQTDATGGGNPEGSTKIVAEQGGAIHDPMKGAF